MERYTKKIKKAAGIGLWGSVAVVILAAAFTLASPYRFYASRHTMQWMLVAGSILAVLAVSMSLLVIRRQIPALRQTEGLKAKLEGYSRHIASLYYSMLAIVTMVCAMAVLSAQNTLLMLAMVATLMLFLAYPNMYRMKVELGLSDDEMRSLYGDKHIGGNEE